MNLSRLTKASVLEVLYEDHVRTARAKGLANARGRQRARAAQRAGPDRHGDRPRCSAGCWAAR